MGQFQSKQQPQLWQPDMGTNKCKDCAIMYISHYGYFGLHVEDLITKHVQIQIAIQEKYNLFFNFKYSDCKCIAPSHSHTQLKWF